jgi:hypothetical protein
MVFFVFLKLGESTAYNMYASMNGGQAVRKEGVSLENFVARILLRDVVM